VSIASRAIAATPAACQVLRVVLVLGPAVGGMAQHVAGLVRGLDPSRFDVSLAGMPDDPAARAARSRGCAVHPLRFGASPGRTAAAALRLGALVRRHHCHLVHAHGYSAAGAAALARRIAGRTRLVCTLHGFLTGIDSQPITGWRARWLLSLVARRADRIITVSDSLHAQFDGIAAVPQSKLLTIPNGIDLSAFAQPEPAWARRELSLPQDAPVVGMVGRLAAQKGPLEFVRAAALVSRRFPEARFALIGDGPLRPGVESLARELGLASRLTLAGHRAEAPVLTQAFDVAVVASLSEGSSLTAMEAMAWGKPVVATAVGGVREVVADGETGVLVAPGDAQALAEAAAGLLADRERAQVMGAAGRRRVEREFSLTRMIERTEEVYLTTVHGTSPGRSDRCA
jgi:glycosyltransferase involved in cell wall biosynthesis